MHDSRGRGEKARREKHRRYPKAERDKMTRIMMSHFLPNVPPDGNLVLLLPPMPLRHRH
jgi:hypothetical protein